MTYIFNRRDASLLYLTGLGRLLGSFVICFGPLVLDTSLLFLSRFQSCLHTPDKLVSESSV
jgi:hypothetical protein